MLALRCATVLVFLCLCALCAHPSQSGKTLNDEDIIELIASGFTVETITAKIDSSPCNFDTSVEALKRLKRANVPEAIILKMIKSGSTNSASKRTKIQCNEGTTAVTLWVAPGKLDKLEELSCEDSVVVLEKSPPFVKVRTDKGNVGFLAIYLLDVAEASSAGKLPSIPRPINPPAAPPPQSRSTETSVARPARPTLDVSSCKSGGRKHD